MSAIWGYVDLATDKTTEMSNLMEQPFHCMKIDDLRAERLGSAVMGCALQHIRSWSKQEQLPICDEDNNIIFTADCLIDNRSDLIPELCPGEENIPDGTLLFYAYKKWGADMAKRVYGCYSYAVWEEKKGILTLGVDHTGSRVLYHQRIGNRIYFSTRMDSIFAGGGKKEINDEWILLFIAQKNLTIHTEPTKTPYRDMYRVQAAHYNVFCIEEEKKVCYWSLKEVKPLRLKNDEEYKQHFLTLFNRCVEESIQGVEEEVGILLSGGFDSTTIAAIASKKLAGKNRKLFGYTHVPIEDYDNRLNTKYIVPDERENVLKFCEMYPNIVPNFLPLPECNGFNHMEESLRVYGLMYKSLVNIDWLHAMYKRAGSEGCRILLTGQFGNATISSGNINSYIKAMYKKGRFLKGFLTLNTNCKLRRYSRKRVFKDSLEMIAKKFLTLNPKEDYLDASLISVNRQTADMVGIKSNDKRLKDNSQTSADRWFSIEEIMELVVNPNALAHISEPETQFSLQNGLALRDPSKDIRIIEFCASLPFECFVNEKGETRRLVRYYCAHLLPPSFLPETAPRGRQSADTIDRISGSWDEIYSAIKECGENKAVLKYIDKESLDKVLEESKDINKIDPYSILQIGAVYMLSLFLKDDM